MAKFETRTHDSTAVPTGASVIGTDAEGATHHVANPVTVDGLPVFVEGPDGSIEIFNLAETPCWEAEDPVGEWIDHVEARRGTWEQITYDRPLVELAAVTEEQLEGKF